MESGPQQRKKANKSKIDLKDVSQKDNEKKEAIDNNSGEAQQTTMNSSVSSIVSVGECRRSSRKKIIKFDVRDLLNKNRKPHKIQIEARIDSNAPSSSNKSSKPVGESTLGGTSLGIHQVDLSSKQKAFMEKSEIFRRFSISQEQPKPPPPLPLPPTLLAKAPDSKEVKPQELVSTGSIIVAQMESGGGSNSAAIIEKRKVLTNPENCSLKTLNIEESISATCQPSMAQQKKRGRPPKNKLLQPQQQPLNDYIDPNTSNMDLIQPQKAKNWKEYKASMAHETPKEFDKVSNSTATVAESSTSIALEKSKIRPCLDQETSIEHDKASISVAAPKSQSPTSAVANANKGDDETNIPAITSSNAANESLTRNSNCELTTRSPHAAISQSKPLISKKLEEFKTLELDKKAAKQVFKTTIPENASSNTVKDSKDVDSLAPEPSKNIISITSKTESSTLSAIEAPKIVETHKEYLDIPVVAREETIESTELLQSGIIEESSYLNKADPECKPTESSLNLAVESSNNMDSKKYTKTNKNKNRSKKHGRKISQDSTEKEKQTAGVVQKSDDDVNILIAEKAEEPHSNTRDQGNTLEETISKTKATEITVVSALPGTQANKKTNIAMNLELVKQNESEKQSNNNVAHGSTTEVHTTKTNIIPETTLKSNKNETTPKRRTRKSRFKNLHETLDVVVGTAEQVVLSPCSDDKASLAPSPNCEKTNAQISEPTAKVTDTLSYEESKTFFVRDVSIETNTLLDILRTVQSNKEEGVVAATRSVSKATIVPSPSPPQPSATETKKEAKSISSSSSKCFEIETETISQSINLDLESQIPNTKETRTSNADCHTSSACLDSVELTETDKNTEELTDRPTLSTSHQSKAAMSEQPNETGSGSISDGPNLENVVKETKEELVSHDLLHSTPSNRPSSSMSVDSAKSDNQANTSGIACNRPNSSMSAQSAKQPDKSYADDEEELNALLLSCSSQSMSSMKIARKLELDSASSSPNGSVTSSSPITTKKNTRRYERRSRRGDDDSSHNKTLEETFAEIAALSSKAVLEMTQGQTDQKEVEETESQLEDKSKELCHDSKKENISNQEEISADESKKPTEIAVMEEKPNCRDSNVVTPTRRGRKVKSIELSQSPNIPTVTNKISSEINKESDKIVDSPKPQAPVEPIKENKVEQKSKIDDLKQANQNELIKNDQITEEIKINESLDVLKPSTPPASNLPIEKELEKEVADKTDKSSPNKLLSHASKKSSSSSSLSAKKSPTKSIEDNINTQEQSGTVPPTKRGRKPKTQNSAQCETTPTSSVGGSGGGGSKKKNKKITNEFEATDENKKEMEPTNNAATSTESFTTTVEKSTEEKIAKKSRQKRLKEAFEAVLNDDGCLPAQIDDSTSLGLTLIQDTTNTAESTTATSMVRRESVKETITINKPKDIDEDSDPLKDIEKFIEAGVNLLKKGYKIDEDSIDNVIMSVSPNSSSSSKEQQANIEANTITATTPAKDNDDSTRSVIATTPLIFNTLFETPADTPIATPSCSPPPAAETISADENSGGGVRRSHRIKQITKTPKALVGRGLVRDKERFSIKDDIETKSHYTIDDHLMDLAEVEAKNAKFLKEMEERLSNFQVIKENDYKCERVVSREAKKMICDCFLTPEEEERGELGCGEDCLNRLLMIECGPECNVKERCTNKRFQIFLSSPCRVFRTEKKGFGILADIEILPGEFIMEYVGEVIDTEEFENRRVAYSRDKNRHYYFMALRSDAIIDATIKGNISRFINHSCDPNAETQKWTVNGELRIGFFSRKSIMPGEEITFNYQYQRYGREAQRCYCESSNCRGWIGQEPTSDEGEQIDDSEDDDEEEDFEEEEEEDAANILADVDEEEDSDTASVSDPEEVQKKLEMAAAQAEVDLTPISTTEDKLLTKDKFHKKSEQKHDENDESASQKKENAEEDSKSKFKKLLSKMAEKVAAKQKQSKLKRRKKLHQKTTKETAMELSRSLEDPDIEDEVEFLRRCGLKNQLDTLRLSRLMVRAKLVQTRLNLLEILRKGELPCRRLFLDYHGLRLLHGWMNEDGGNMQIRLSLLQTLETLPIANKTILTDSKVMQVVRNWCGESTQKQQSNLSPPPPANPNEDSISSNSQDNNQTMSPQQENPSTDVQALQKLSSKLIAGWDGLAEIFRIPKKERIEQMKEHEREADRQYAELSSQTDTNAPSTHATTTDRYQRDRFGRSLNYSSGSSRFSKPSSSTKTIQSQNLQTCPINVNRGSLPTPENMKNLSKTQRREMFAARVARDEAEKRIAEERREFETKCRFFGLDPKKTRPQDVPFCVNPSTGQWYSIERKPIITPPSYAHVQVPVKLKSTDPSDYQLPAAVFTLPPQWKYAITPQAKLYYYHVRHRVPQWEPPTPAQLQAELDRELDEAESGEIANTVQTEESSDDDESILIGMDAAELKAYIDRKVQTRRQKRYQRLVVEKPISPRREEDRIYNQIEVRKYKENKEKIRKRKEEKRRKRAEALRYPLASGSSDSSGVVIKTEEDSDENLSGALPIQDYLLSSDDDETDIKPELNSRLIDKIMEGDKIVDELDALTTKKPLKRPLPPHRQLVGAADEAATSSDMAAILANDNRQVEYKKRKVDKKEKRKPKDLDQKYRKIKEKFRCEIAGIIVHYLKPFRKDTCLIGRIQSDEDFNHLARKLTHFVMVKECKYCDAVGQTLVVTESVKNKSKEFIKKYMTKYENGYVRPTNDPEYKDIPFSL